MAGEGRRIGKFAGTLVVGILLGTTVARAGMRIVALAASHEPDGSVAGTAIIGVVVAVGVVVAGLAGALPRGRVLGVLAVAGLLLALAPGVAGLVLNGGPELSKALESGHGTAGVVTGTLVTGLGVLGAPAAVWWRGRRRRRAAPGAGRVVALRTEVVLGEADAWRPTVG